MDKFTLAYIECALWSSTDNDGNPLDDNCSADDIEQDTFRQMEDDCKDFQESNNELLMKAYCHNAGYSEDYAGHDFWLTRNGHGAGFWDRGLGDIGKELTEAAKAYGGVDLMLDEDGKIY